MADYAIVIGIRDYPTGFTSQFGTLTSPVKDAVKAARCLRDVVGLKGENIWTFLHPKDWPPEAAGLTAEEFPNGVNGATSADLIGFLNCSDKDAIDQTGFASKIQKPGPGEQGGRLFVFFAGHGVVAPMSGGYFLDAIVPPDYGKPVVPMIACDWIVRNLRTLPIARQVIIFDCCRNVFEKREDPAARGDPQSGQGRLPERHLLDEAVLSSGRREHVPASVDRPRQTGQPRR